MKKSEPLWFPNWIRILRYLYNNEVYFKRDINVDCTLIARKLNITISHCYLITNRLKEYDIVDIELKDKSKIITLTEKGNIIAEKAIKFYDFFITRVSEKNESR